MARRLNFAALRERNDAIAWASIRARAMPESSSIGLVSSGRPADFEELAEAVRGGQELGFAFSHFLDEFYLFRAASFFAKEPPEFFSQPDRAFLAATAEFLSRNFDLLVPAWTCREEYFLDEEWDWAADRGSLPEELLSSIDRRRDRATPEFRIRNILYEGRNLIRL